MRAWCSGAIVVVVFLASSAASAQACGSPSGTTYARVGSARVYTGPSGPGRRPPRTFACVGGHTPVALDNGRTTSAILPLGEPFEDPTAPVLVYRGSKESFVAYARRDGGAERVLLVDLRSHHKIASRPYLAAGNACYHCLALQFSELFVTRDDEVVYAEADVSDCANTPQTCTAEVAVLNAGTPVATRVVDSGAGIDPASLAVSEDGHIWWLHGGALRGALLHPGKPVT